MKIVCKIYTTSKTPWFTKDFPYIIAKLKEAKGVNDVTIDVENIDIQSVELAQGSSAFVVTPTWKWFHDTLTTKAVGYNAVGLLISREDARRLGIYGINGDYYNDPDEIFEFLIIANKGQESDYYWKEDMMTEFTRLMLHELGGHGFETFTKGYASNMTHEYDYGPGGVNNRRTWKLPQLLAQMDFTEWDRLAAQRDALLGIKVGLLQRLYENIKVALFAKNLHMPMNDALYKVAYDNLGKHCTMDESVPAVIGCGEAISYLVNLVAPGLLPERGIAGTADWLAFMESSPRFQKVNEPEVGSIMVFGTGTGNGSIRGHIFDVGKFHLLSNNSDNGLLGDRWTRQTALAHYRDFGGMQPHYFNLIA